MKIDQVRILRLEQSLWGPFWEAQKKAPSASPLSRYAEYAGSLDSWWWPQALVIVRIDAGGYHGIGWAEDGTGAAQAVLERHFKGLLEGQDAGRIERLWDILYRASIPYGRKGVAIEALSAVDIALWDLAGKAAGKPVHALLGGALRDRLPVYASHLQPVANDLLVEEARAYMEEGYRAMKTRFPAHAGMGAAGIRRNVEHIALLRETIGAGVDLMADAYMGWDLRFARRMTKELEPFDLGWIEEPLLPDELDAYVALCRHSRIPISHGENEFTPYGFHQILQARAAHVLQPDVHRAGGITAVRKIAALAEAAGVEVIPHAFSAPTVQVMAALPNFRILEYLTVPVWARKNLEEMVPVFLGEPRVEHGEVGLNDRPGLGIELNADAYPELKPLC
ncbi:MAG: enolase C-terminal domain-like protein [Terrimicrobiaceae bacterium]|nr:enolase C-terminal domain-like protein [Terrimicrobiaceae bacterium]